MNRDILIGIGTGAAICAAGIVYSPPLGPDVAWIFAGIIGALALMTVAGRHHPAATGCRATGLVLIGAYAIASGILVGPAALLTAVLMAGAGILLERTLLRGGVSGQRLPGGDSA